MAARFEDYVTGPESRGGVHPNGRAAFTLGLEADINCHEAMWKPQVQ